MNRRLVVLVALVAGSVVSIALAMLRDAAAGDVGFWFLVWNLGLAWIPFLLALGAYAYARRPSSMIALGYATLYRALAPRVER